MNIFRIEAEQLRNGAVDLAVDNLPREFGIEDEEWFRFEDRITGTLNVSIASQTVMIRGRLSTIVTATCVRCVEPIRVPMKMDVELYYMHDERMLQLDRYPELFGENAVYFDGELVEPARELRELLLLELPPFPACELEPKGICPVFHRDMSRMTFGDDEPAAPEAPAKAPPPAKPSPVSGKMPGATKGDAAGWKNQLEAARKKLEAEPPPSGGVGG